MENQKEKGEGGAKYLPNQESPWALLAFKLI